MAFMLESGKPVKNKIYVLMTHTTQECVTWIPHGGTLHEGS